MDVERVLRLLGNPGRYQVLVYVLLCCNYFPVAVNHLVMAIYGAKTPHRCQVPQIIDDFNSYTTAITTSSVTPPDTTPTTSQCYETVDNETRTCQYGWDYTHQHREYNIIMQWDLVCDRAYMVNMATTVYFAGVMLGGIIFGTLADRFGRKPLMLSALYGHIFVGTGLAFANSYTVFVILRFFLGMLLQGLQTCTFVLLMEQYSVRHRTIVGTVFEIFWGVGVIWLALVAMLVREWRFIQLALTLPSVLTIVYIWAIPESLRWLVAHNRLREAEQVVRKAAKFNRVRLPEDLLCAADQNHQLIDRKRSNEAEPTKHTSEPTCTTADTGTTEGAARGSSSSVAVGKTYHLLDLFKTKQLCITSLIMFYIWFVVAVSYYGLTLSITSLSGNKYMNLLIGGAIELPAYAFAVYILNRFGRRIPLTCYLCIGGVICIIAGCLPSSTKAGTDDTMMWVSTGLAVVGRCSIASCWSVILLYTSELYPTVIRNIGMGTCAFWNRVGGMVAPQILLLGTYWSEWIPVVVFGLLALIGGALTLRLPETHGLPLTDNLTDTTDQCDGGVCNSSGEKDDAKHLSFEKLHGTKYTLDGDADHNKVYKGKFVSNMV